MAYLADPFRIRSIIRHDISIFPKGGLQFLNTMLPLTYIKHNTTYEMRYKYVDKIRNTWLIKLEAVYRL